LTNSSWTWIGVIILAPNRLLPTGDTCPLCARPGALISPTAAIGRPAAQSLNDLQVPPPGAP
jgi:hypothetical protein